MESRLEAVKLDEWAGGEGEGRVGGWVVYYDYWVDQQNKTPEGLAASKQKTVVQCNTGGACLHKQWAQLGLGWQQVELFAYPFGGGLPRLPLACLR